MAEGTGITKHPLLKLSLIEPCRQFYQPIIPLCVRGKPESAYQREFVKQNCLDINAGLGAVFTQRSGRIERVDGSIPPCGKDCEIFSVGEWRPLIIQTLKLQERLFCDSNLGMDELPAEQKKQIESMRRIVKDTSRKYIHLVEDGKIRG